jgi:hypothetical protein
MSHYEIVLRWDGSPESIPQPFEWGHGQYSLFISCDGGYEAAVGHALRVWNDPCVVVHEGYVTTVLGDRTALLESNGEMLPEPLHRDCCPEFFATAAV